MVFTFLYISPIDWRGVLVVTTLMIIGINSLNEFFLLVSDHSTYEWIQLSLNMSFPIILYLERVVFPRSTLIPAITMVSWFLLTILLKFIFRKVRVSILKRSVS